MRGFRGDAFGVRGSLEELPLTSIYAVFNPSRTISPYVGVSGGLVQLKDFRANGYGDTLLTAAGSTFEYGGIVGAAVGPAHGRWSVFGEAKWTWRQFDGPTWSGGRVPPVLQSPLKLWTRTYTVGAQFRIATPKP
jgi:hypothetical protein